MKSFLRDIGVGTTSILLSCAVIYGVKKALHAAFPEAAHAMLVEKVIPVPEKIVVVKTDAVV